MCLRGDCSSGRAKGYEREVLDTAIVGYWVTKNIRGYTTEDVFNVSTHVVIEQVSTVKQ